MSTKYGIFCNTRLKRHEYKNTLLTKKCFIHSGIKNYETIHKRRIIKFSFLFKNLDYSNILSIFVSSIIKQNYMDSIIKVTIAGYEVKNIKWNPIDKCFCWTS